MMRMVVVVLSLAFSAAAAVAGSGPEAPVGAEAPASSRQSPTRPIGPGDDVGTVRRKPGQPSATQNAVPPKPAVRDEDVDEEDEDED